MSLVKRNDGVFLIRHDHQTPDGAQFGTISQARAFMSMPLDAAIELAAKYRDAGIECFAANDAGRFEDPSYVAPQQTVDLSVNWPDTWRVEIEQLGETRFVHRFLDAYKVQHSVVAISPQQLVEKLYGSIDPAIREYLKAITPEPELAIPAAPPIPTTPGKILRPGSRNLTPEDEADLLAQRAEQQKPKVPPQQIEYKFFYDNSPSAAVRDRIVKDPDFLAWLNGSGALAPRSTTDGRTSL